MYLLSWKKGQDLGFELKFTDGTDSEQYYIFFTSNLALFTLATVTLLYRQLHCTWFAWKKILSEITTAQKLLLPSFYLSLKKFAKRFLLERLMQYPLFFYLTNRFHVVVRLFSNRSQMTSKCGKNKEVAHEPQASVSVMFLPHFDVLCDLLLNRPTATERKKKQEKKTDTHTCLLPLDSSKICASLGIFKVAWYSFSGSISPKFEHKVRLHKQRFEKIATTVVLEKDENLLWLGLQRHPSCHSDEMTLLPILLAAVYLRTGNCSSKIAYGSFFLE